MNLDYKSFLEQIFHKLDNLDVDVSNLYLDHIGYQSSSKEDYEICKRELLMAGKEMSEAVVGGRRVEIIKLNNPIEYNERVIPVIEVIEPKEGQVCPSALEHIEFVLDSSFEEFVHKYSKINWNTSKIDQPVFPMITLDLGDNIQVKFHLKPVLEIVEESK